jgi:hypothetical protein
VLAYGTDSIENLAFTSHLLITKSTIAMDSFIARKWDFGMQRVAVGVFSGSTFLPVAALGGNVRRSVHKKCNAQN